MNQTNLATANTHLDAAKTQCHALERAASRAEAEAINEQYQDEIRGAEIELETALTDIVGKLYDWFDYLNDNECPKWDTRYEAAVCLAECLDEIDLSLLDKVKTLG